jgi:hypothetical protein
MPNESLDLQPLNDHVRTQEAHSSPCSLRCVLGKQFSGSLNFGFIVATPMPLLGRVPSDNLGKLLSGQLVELLDCGNGGYTEVVQFRSPDYGLLGRVLDKLGRDLDVRLAHYASKQIEHIHQSLTSFRP